MYPCVIPVWHKQPRKPTKLTAPLTRAKPAFLSSAVLILRRETGQEESCSKHKKPNWGWEDEGCPGFLSPDRKKGISNISLRNFQVYHFTATQMAAPFSDVKPAFLSSVVLIRNLQGHWVEIMGFSRIPPVNAGFHSNFQDNFLFRVAEAIGGGLPEGWSRTTAGFQ